MATIFISEWESSRTYSRPTYVMYHGNLCVVSPGTNKEPVELPDGDIFGMKIAKLTAQRDELLAALKEVYRYYVSTLESGRDRIVMLGGDCDPVDMMEERNPVLIKVRALVKKYDHA